MALAGHRSSFGLVTEDGELNQDVLVAFGMPSPKTFKIAIVALVLLALALAWRFTGLAEAAASDRVAAFLTAHTHGPWGPVLVVVAFVLGSAVSFPVTILMLATAATFGPVKGGLCSALGIAVSAPINYWVGARFGQEPLARLMGARWDSLRERLRSRGVLAVAAIRVLPVAPFTLINLAAGASAIRFGDFLLGTMLGMLPGLVVASVLGDRIVAIVSDPSLAQVGLFALSVSAWIGLAVGAQALASRLGRREARSSAALAPPGAANGEQEGQRHQDAGQQR